MKQYIRNEILKNKRKHLVTISSSIILLSIFLGAFIYSANKRNFSVIPNQWIALWSQAGFYFSQIFFPVLIATIIALNFAGEYRNNNIEYLRTIPISLNQMMIAKFIVFSWITLELIVEFNLIFWLTGKVINITNNYNIWMFLQWGIYGWIGSMTIIAVQMMLSCYLRKEISAIIFSLIGSMGGFILLFISQKIQVSIGLGSRTLEPLHGKEVFYFMLLNIIWIVICYLLSMRRFSKNYVF